MKDHRKQAADALNEAYQRSLEIANTARDFPKIGCVQHDCDECRSRADYKTLYEQMCERCDELDAKLAEYEQPEQEREPVKWPKGRDLFLRDDMGGGQLRVLLDGDNDMILAIWPDSQPSASLEFCNGFNGGGKSPETRKALIALMCAMERDGARNTPRDSTAPQPAQQPLTDEQAHDMGAKGGPPTEHERLLFEAWMRGHCWKVEGDWNGKTYVHTAEKSGDVHGGAMRTRGLWAAWRDRAALANPHDITGEKK